MTATDVRTSAQKAAPSIGLIVVALGIVYVVWGSTYLGIRIVVEEAPPLTSMGIRFVTAGTLLGLVLALKGGFRRLVVLRVSWPARHFSA